jgi:hypothetical protein
VVFKTFSELIPTEGEAKPVAGVIDMAKVEAAVKRVPNVSSYAFDPVTREITVGYAGFYKNIKEIKIAIEGQGVSCEPVNPARVVVRPLGKIEKPDGALSALRGVAGVVEVAPDNNDLVAYADLKTLSLEALCAAVEGAGFKCQIASHEEIKVSYSAAGSVEPLKADLLRTKWVLKADVDAGGSCVKVLAVKGRVTKSAVKSVMAKHGFPEAK